MASQKILVSRAVLWILVTTLLISGSAFTSWLYFLHSKERRLHDDQFRIVALIQSSPQTEALKTVYLAELLGLSLDRPINLYQFNVKAAHQALINNPLIKSATIKKILPGTLYIDYEIRTPLAYVGDFANAVVDEEGILFPFSPFFTPKRLPTLYLEFNKEGCQWGACLKNIPSFQLGLNLLNQFRCAKQEAFHLKQIDVTQALADSYGQRQIVMVLEQKSQYLEQKSENPLIFLRLSSHQPEQNLANFWKLQANLFKKNEKIMAKGQSVVYDLRIPHLAFIKTAR